MRDPGWFWKAVVTAVVGLVITVAVAGGTSLIAQGNRITTLETKRESDKEQLDRMEGKLDRLLRRER